MLPKRKTLNRSVQDELATKAEALLKRVKYQILMIR